MTIRRGVMIAIAAAVSFGATTPVVAWAGAWVGPFATACLLYAGGAAASVVRKLIERKHEDEHGLTRGDLPRVLMVAIFGAAIAPALLAWGLFRAGATVGALLLNLEAVFTVLLARAVYREPIGGRVALAAAAMVAGGVALVLDLSRAATWQPLGAIAVAGATLGWALDNTLSRPLAERDPVAVVAAKGALGAVFTATAAVIAGEHIPPLGPVLALVACGATGYGISLQLYLLAQRRIGIARTGSVFAIAPFVGAAIAIAAGDRALSATTAGAAALFAIGVWLHATERHAHDHVHEAIDHDHPHRHDDGHHTHLHDPPVEGVHSHSHHHDRIEHEHEHALDLHHDHH